MAMEECPLPEVSEALSPFIKPRDEVANIRLGLQTYLQTQLRTSEASLSSLNLAEPPIEPIENPGSSVTGARRAYWKALQAHATAQAKYEALRAELDQIKQGKAATATAEPDVTGTSSEEYITLLRQREKYRKLKVVDRALSNISSTEDDSLISNLDDIVKKKTGDAPVPPPSQPSFNRSPEVEAKVMELKKAIVSTKRRTEEQRIRMSPTVNDTSQSTSQGEIAGLQNALQELTVWMESQLTLIANAEADATTNEDDQAANGTSTQSAVSIEDIEALYDQYLETRQRLIETTNDEPASPDTNGLSFDSDMSASRSLDSKSPIKTSAEILLPYIPALLASKQEEQTLLNQTAHTRKQMASTEGEMSNVIQRFAGESHLVQPDAIHGEDWAAAAKESGAVTGKSIKERITVGEQAAQSAKASLDSIQNLPQSLQSAVK